MTTRSVPKSIPTDEELMALPKDGYKRELLDGEIVMTPAGYDHGFESADLIITLGSYVWSKKLGRLLDGQSGFRMASGDVLSPDVSFISTARSPDLRVRGSFYEGAPDLAVEFLSPSESKKHVETKFSRYLSNQTKLVWIVDPRKRAVSVHRNNGTTQTLSEFEMLSGEEVIPGFTIAVKSLFADSPQ